jgi:hypothetical protein
MLSQSTWHGLLQPRSGGNDLPSQRCNDQRQCRFGLVEKSARSEIFKKLAGRLGERYLRKDLGTLAVIIGFEKSRKVHLMEFLWVVVKCELMT